MKINLTKKEFETLLDVMYMADWIVRAHDEQDDDGAKRYKDLEQKIMALAGEFGLDKAVQLNKETNQYYLLKEHLEASDATARIEKFENATFWEELLERLARRDFIRAYGEEAILKMPINERFEKEMEFFKQYDNEFGENGLENLHIVTLAAKLKN